MSERGKEFLGATVFFVGAVALFAYAISGRVALGTMSLCDTKGMCAIWGAALVVGGAISLLGNHRLNVWINPRLEKIADKRRKAKERREATRAELDLKDPSRVTRREVWKARLFGLSILLLLALCVLLIVTQSRVIALVCFALCVVLWALCASE